MYAQVTGSTITTVSSQLPKAARRLDTQQWVMFIESTPAALLAECGWFAVVPTQRPADTATHTHSRSVELVGGVPTVVWTSVPKPPSQVQAETRDATRDSIETKARSALTANQTFLDLASPTNAQIVAQVRSLTRQANGLIKTLFAGNLLDNDGGT
jgi:hypothetical protein